MKFGEATTLPTVRFLLSRTQELEAASKSFLVDTISSLKAWYSPHDANARKQHKLRRCKLLGSSVVSQSDPQKSPYAKCNSRGPVLILL